MKKLLIITRDFPPYEGRGGVMRILKFAAYLPEFGWKASIFCEKKGVTGDNSLRKEIDGKAEVIPVAWKSPSQQKNYHKERLNAPDVSTIQKVHSLSYRSLYFNLLMSYHNYFMAPDLHWPWAQQTIEHALNLHKDRSFDALLTSGPPFSTFRAGIEIQKSTQLPLALDFRDGWWKNPLYKNWKKKFIDAQNRLLEKQAVSVAGLALFVSDPLTEIYQKRYPAAQCRMRTLENGFDSNDFKEISSPNDTKTDTLNFIFCGSVGGRRDPGPFLSAVEQIKKDFPEWAENVRISFVGRFRGDKEGWKKRLGNMLEITGEVNHEKAIRYMTAADILVLITHASEGGKTVMSGKIYEYAALRKPILAVAHECAATDFIRKYNAGFVVGYEKIDVITSMLKTIIGMWKEGEEFPRIGRETLRLYERKRLAGILGGELDKLIEQLSPRRVR
ncbi:MAG: glycosyltransferase [Chitinivibrionales bacterium]|nr:glycosyltransferase [Chitinivibrionales bacterium]